MRLPVFLLWLLVPVMGMALPICPAGYILNDLKMCEQKWDVATGSCPDGSYFNAKKQACVPRCPYRSQDEVSSQGDHVCQVDGEREWLDKYRKLCADKGMQYLPQINMCLVPPAAPEKPELVENCPQGQVWHVRNGEYACVRGNPQKVISELKERLQTKGLDYIEYLEGIKDIQTNRFAAEVMQYRWEEATGVRQTQEQKEAAILAATKCPDQYVPTTEGGCKPSKSCDAYGCPKGQVSEILYQGKNQYCHCRVVETPKTPTSYRLW